MNEWRDRAHSILSESHAKSAKTAKRPAVNSAGGSLGAFGSFGTGVTTEARIAVAIAYLRRGLPAFALACLEGREPPRMRCRRTPPPLPAEVGRR